MATHALEWHQTPPDACRGGVLSIGNFDGAHRGHAALLAAARGPARKLGGPVVVLTFDPHPLALLRPAHVQPLLTTLDDRARLLHDLGADQVVVVRPTPEFLTLTARKFFQRVVQDCFAAQHLVEGTSFGFGRDREGTVETLARLCGEAGMGLTVVPPVIIGGAEVSSSRVRAALRGGDVAEANDLLGRPYRLTGTVAAGARRGRTIGFPTANLSEMPTLVPGDGVYAVRGLLPEGSWPGAANVGPNPTFGEDARKVEVHLIDYSGDLYSRQLSVAFLRRLRDTRPFNGVAELTAQLRTDVDQARAIAGESSDA